MRTEKKPEFKWQFYAIRRLEDGEWFGGSMSPGGVRGPWIPLWFTHYLQAMPWPSKTSAENFARRHNFGDCESVPVEVARKRGKDRVIGLTQVSEVT